MLLAYTVMQVGFSTGWINTVTTLPTETVKLRNSSPRTEIIVQISHQHTLLADTHTQTHSNRTKRP